MPPIVPADPPPDQPWTRRHFLKAGVAVAAGLATLGAATWLGSTSRASSATASRQLVAGSDAPPSPTPGASADASVSAAPRRRYHSRPDLSAPVIDVTAGSGTLTPGLLFLTPDNGLAPDGLLIVDDVGEPVWIRPDGKLGATNFRVSSYHGQPVLSWWEGTVNGGLGDGEYVIADTAYRELVRVRAAERLSGDLHEFLITPSDTALLLAGSQVAAPVDPGSSQPPWLVWDCVVQEIDVASGERLFEWHTVDHIELSESKTSPPADGTAVYDYVHANSVGLDDDGNLLISARNTSAVYKVDRSSGEIIWRLGGRRSDFAMGDGATFAWQHDARRQADGTLTVFDDEQAPTPARGLVLRLDETAMTATFEREYRHPRGLTVMSQGNLQTLGDGHVLVGWGSAGVYSEFDAAGRLVTDGSFPGSKQSYRCYRFPWTARPTDPPDLAVVPAGAGAAIVCCSWNGATDVIAWEVRAGPDTDGLRSIARGARTGFETEIVVADAGPWFAVDALDALGRVIGHSAVIRTTT